MDEQINTQSSVSPKNLINYKQIIVIVGLTALVVGTGTYLVQQLISNKVTSTLKNDYQQQIAKIEREAYSQPEKQPDPTPSEIFQGQTLNTYSNDPANYSIQYPSAYKINDYSLWNGSQFLHQIKFFQDEKDYFMVRVQDTEDSLYYLDNQPVGEIKLGDITAKKYIFDKEIKEGPGGLPLMVVVSGYKAGKRYTIEFYNTKEISSRNQEILSSFKFLL